MTRRWFDRFSSWIGASPRRKAIAVLCAVAVVATAIIVPLSLGGRDLEDEPPILRAEGCKAAPAIDPTRAGTGKGDWRRLAVPPDAACATLTPAQRDAGGIAPTTSFVLTAAEAIDAASATERLVVEPAVPLDVRAQSPTSLLVQPRSALVAGVVYRFALLDAPGGRPVQRWAFQTQSPLRVVQTLPRDTSTEVPLNTGIELTFSQDGVVGVEDRFAISPATEGRFEVHKRVFVFIPKKLRPRTLYTVTLKPGVSIDGSKQKMASPFNFRFETGTEERSGSTPGEPLLQFGRAVWESVPSEPPVVSLFLLDGGTGSKPPATVPFTVYRFSDVDAFLANLGRFTAIPAWAGGTRSRYQPQTKGLSKAISFNGRLQRLGEQGDLFVRFPDTLAAGFYLVTTEYAGVPIQTWLQVTDVATYAAVSRDRTLVWVNDLASKRALSGATVRVAGGSQAGTTGADGTSAFETPADLLTLRPSELGEDAEVSGNLVVTARDGRLAVVPLADLFSGFHSFEFREYTFSGDPTPYWRFLYADRDLYRPTDTVRFWGLVRHRTTAVAKQDIVLEITNPYDELSGGPVTVARTTVRTTPRGTFIGELPFAGASPGYYQLIARVGDRTIASAYLQIEDFVKPAYKLDVLPSRKAVVSGQQVTYSVTASFFEGSPVPSLGLGYAFGGSGSGSGGKSLVTDGVGHATVEQRPKSTTISFDGLRVFPSRAEEGEISGAASVYVFPATVALESAGVVTGNRGRVQGTVFNIDFEKLNSEQNPDIFDYRGTPASGRRVTADVTEVTWTQVEDGEEYDFIAKTVRKRYTYRERRRNIGRFSDSSDARGAFSIGFPANAKRTYEVALRVTDQAGRAYTETTYVYSGFDLFSAFPYVAELSQGPYALGDQVSVAMRLRDADMPSGNANRYLFFTAAGGIRDHSIQSGPRFAFRFAEKHVPNVEVLAVRFDGVTYQESNAGLVARFDAELRRLSVSVVPARARYRPGETATLNVRVTDRAGRPVRAEVLLSAVDEALYRVRPDSFSEDRDILTSLYDPVSSGVLKAYASHRFPLEFGGAEFGGEGADRVDFRDVGIFTRVTTGADGRASTPFKLPDNLTSWRVTALALTDDLKAGSTTALVQVGLPVFVDVGMNDSYLRSDRPLARVRAFGSELKSADTVAFRLEAPTLGKPVTASGKAFRPVDMALPALREGSHKIRITVSARGRTDTVVRTIFVVASRLTHVEARHTEVGPGETFTPQGNDRGLTSIVLTDHNRGRYYPIVEELSWSYGDRVDQMLARNISQELLVKYFGEIAPFPALFRPSAYQTEDGGIAIFPFADDDLAISARVAALAPDRFGRQALAQYFDKVLADPKETRERGIIALYGLASLREPVLLEVERAAVEKDLSARERLYVGLAAHELGDDATAKRLYRAVLERYGESRGGAVRLDVGKDKDDILEATSLAAILGAELADDAAPALFEHTLRNSAKDLLVALEQISFLSEVLPRLSHEASRVAYTVGGKRETRELAEGESVALVLDPGQRQSLKLEVLGGRVGVATSWLSTLGAKDVPADPNATLTRTWDGETTGPAKLKDGALVQIVIDYKLTAKALDGCYQVTDLLPSGLRAVTRPYDVGIENQSLTYPYSIEGQRVSFCVYPSQDRTIVYYARVIGMGTFTAESATIHSQQGPERLSRTPALRVEIS